MTDVKLEVDLYPSRNAMQVDGTYRYVNATSTPIAALHIRTLPGAASLRAVSVPGAKLVHDDKKFNYHIFQFEQPLKPGASGTMSFRTVIEKRGLAALPSDRRSYEVDAQPAANGTYAIGQVFAPILGMSRLGFLEGNSQRRKYGLAPGVPTPKLENRAALANNYAGVTRVNTDITVTTDADQTLVVTGARVSDTVANGRRTARFVSPIPTLNFITIQSARYQVKSADAGGVKLSVFTARPGEVGFGAADVVAMQRFRIGSGEHEVRVVTRQKPVYAGIDPYVSFIDRNSNDNIVQILDSTRTLH